MKTPNAPQLLEPVAEKALQALRDACRAVVEGLPNPARRAAELSRVLRISPKLGWQVWQICGGGDPAKVLHRMPGRQGIEIFLQAAGRHVNAAVIENARAAFQKIERVATTHAGSRAELAVMVTPRDADDARSAAEQRRRAAFESAAAIWGVQARVHLSVNILKPSRRDPQRLDLALISGKIGLRRNRRDRAWPLAMLAQADTDGQAPGPAQRRPIAPCPDQRFGGVPIIAEFSTQPMADVRRHPLPVGGCELELAPGPVGETGAVTFVSGELMENVGWRYRRPGETTADLNANILTPCRALVHDVLVRRDAFGPIRPTGAVYSQLQGLVRSRFLRLERDRLPIAAVVERVAGGIEAAGLEDVPRYRDLLRFALGNLGWNARDFDMFRLRMSYPVLSTAVVVSFDLPDAPSGV